MRLFASVTGLAACLGLLAIALPWREEARLCVVSLERNQTTLNGLQAQVVQLTQLRQQLEEERDRLHQQVVSQSAALMALQAAQEHWAEQAAPDACLVAPPGRQGRRRGP